MVYHISEFLLSSPSVTFTSSFSLPCMLKTFQDSPLFSFFPYCIYLVVSTSSVLTTLRVSFTARSQVPVRCLHCFFFPPYTVILLLKNVQHILVVSFSWVSFLLSVSSIIQPTNRTQTSALTVFSWAPLFISSAVAVGAYLRVCGSLSGNFSVDMLVIMLFLKIFF